MRQLASLLLPGGLVVLAGLGLLRPGILPDAAEPYLLAAPAAVLGIGALLGWLFNRSRVVFGLLILAAADAGLRGFRGAAGPDPIVFVLLTVLLPLNLAAYGALSERGLFTERGLARLLAIPVQGVVVGLLALSGWRGPAAWLGLPLLNARFTAWTDLPQAALATFAAAGAWLAVRCLRARGALEAGFLWALVASFLALHGLRFGWAPTSFLATGGLALIVALVAASYRMAFHDDLTGLPGRRALNEALLRLGSRYAMAMVDVDHFKRFNDTHGHDVGDQVLRMVAARLAAVSGGGTAFRYGGEEFTVLFPGRSAEEALPHLEELRRAIAASRFSLRGPDRPRKRPDAPPARRAAAQTVSVTVSIGVAERTGRQADPAQVIKAADQALYRAKEAGRNRVVIDC
jgi:diguanylate cyclase (GGDEF)-like protein